MATIGLRELRQDASEIVRRVEAGEHFDVTVSGRLAAQLIPARPKSWLRWEEIAAAFDGRADPECDRDRDVVDQTVADPWTRP